MQHVDDIVDPDEVSALLAIREVRPRALEEPHLAAGADLVERVQDDARHRALVALAEAVDVEELEAAPRGGRVPFPLPPERPEIELLLRIAVRIQRLQTRQECLVVVVPEAPVAVRRRTACVDERHAVRRAEVPELLRVLEIHPPQERDVELRRARARAEVHDSRERRFEAASHSCSRS